MAEFVSCPVCGAKVLTADALLGRRVRCAGCGHRYVAAPDPPAPPAPDLPPPARLPAAPRRGSDYEEDDDEAWPFCPGCGRRVSWQEAVCSHCGEEFDDEEPRARRRSAALPLFRRDGEPHRGKLWYTLGTLSAVAGSLSLCLFGLGALVSIPVGVLVVFLASRDLRLMRDGRMDPQGRRLTEDGRTAALVGVVLGLLFGAFFGLALFNRSLGLFNWIF